MHINRYNNILSYLYQKVKNLNETIINFLLTNSKHSTKSLYDTADILAYFSTFPLGAIMLWILFTRYSFLFIKSYNFVPLITDISFL